MESLIKSAGKSVSDMVQMERWSPGESQHELASQLLAPPLGPERSQYNKLTPSEKEKRQEEGWKGYLRRIELTLWVSCPLQINMQAGELPGLW